jgi:hypothetical protein
VNRHNRVYRWNGRRWIEMPGRLSQVEVAENGDVYGVTPENRVVRWKAGRDIWVRQGGNLRQISAGDGGRLWGVNSDNRVFTAIPGERPRPRPTPVPDDGDWVELGCAKAAFKKDNDAIAVGRDKGAFTALKIKVRRTKIHFYQVSVTYGNGRTEVLPFSGTIGRNGSSAEIDLTGRRRFIRSVQLRHKSRLRLLRGQGVACVYGKRP